MRVSSSRACLLGALLLALLGFAAPFVFIGACAQRQDSFPAGCGQAMIASYLPWVLAAMGAPLGAVTALLLPTRPGRRRPPTGRG